MDFKGKTAIITGSGKGIGRDCAEILTKNGGNAVIADFNLDLAQQTAEYLTKKGRNAKAVQTDVSKVSDIQKMVKFTIETFGGIDILINNAGIFHPTPIAEITEEEWDHIMAVNLKSVFFVTQKVLPYMIRQNHGKIVNLSSLAGRNGGVACGLGYSASKAGIIGLTRGFAAQLAKYHINVNAVAPGSTDTGILSGLSEAETKRVMSSIPLGRYGKIKEISSAITFLCSAEADFITGAVLDINGGMYYG